MTIADGLSHAPPASSGRSAVPIEGPSTKVVKAFVSGLDPCRRFTIHDVVNQDPGTAIEAHRRSLSALALAPPGVGARRKAEDA